MYVIEIGGCEFGIYDGRDGDKLYLSRDPRPLVRTANWELTPGEVWCASFGYTRDYTLPHRTEDQLHVCAIAEVLATHKARQMDRDVRAGRM